MDGGAGTAIDRHYVLQIAPAAFRNAVSIAVRSAHARRPFTLVGSLRRTCGSICGGGAAVTYFDAVRAAYAVQFV